MNASANDGTSDFCDSAFDPSGNPSLQQTEMDGNFGSYAHFLGRKVGNGSGFYGLHSGQSYFQYDGNNGKVGFSLLCYLEGLAANFSSSCVCIRLYLVVAVVFLPNFKQDCHLLLIYLNQQHQ